MRVDNFDPEQTFKIEWMKQGINEKEFVDFSDSFGDYLANLKKHKREETFTFRRLTKEEERLYRDESLSNSQFRNLFSTIKTIEMKGLEDNNSKTKLFMIRPLLEYSFRRKPTKAFEVFKDLTIKMVNEIYSEENLELQKKYFKNFSRILEAILAYHKAHGGN